MKDGHPQEAIDTARDEVGSKEGAIRSPSGKCGTNNGRHSRVDHQPGKDLSIVSGKRVLNYDSLRYKRADTMEVKDEGQKRESTE